MLDDDFDVTADQLNALFDQVGDAEATILTPCHEGAVTYATHHRCAKNSIGYRYVDYIETGAPIFTRDFLIEYLREFDTAVVDWGTDIWFSQKCAAAMPGAPTPGTCRMAISDSVCIGHRKRADGVREADKYGGGDGVRA